jgi:hypothetical protein
LVGFAQIFDSTYGDANTPWPYLVVTPSAVGSAILPFHCPHCGTVCDELVDPNKREHYYDKLRKFSWCPCPDCRGRFFVDRKGTPLATALPAGATVAPSKVERKGGGANGIDVVTSVDVKSPAPVLATGRFTMLGAL